MTAPRVSELTQETAMSTPAAFTFTTQTLRVVMRDGEPWFVAADVCAALGISRTDDGVSRLDDDEKGAGSIRTPGGEQQMTIINESGLYSLILGSRKPEAKKFKKWVTSEVLPAIRKTGAYVHREARPEPRERGLTADERRAISAAVAGITRYLKFSGSGQGVAFAYRLLCLRFGIDKTDQLTPGQLHEALAYLRQLEETTHGFYLEQCDREHAFRENQIAHHKLEAGK
jgi:prophage antirepressor-like protein